MNMNKELEKEPQDHNTAELSDEELQTILGGTAAYSYPAYGLHNERYGYHHHHHRHHYSHHGYHHLGYGTW